MKKETKNFTLYFPAKANYIAPARLAISSLAAQSDFSVQEIEDIKKMFSDACSNAIVQAYSENAKAKDLNLSVDCSMDDKKLNIAISGKGLHIDLKKERA